MTVTIIVSTVSADRTKPWVKTLVDTYHSPEIKAFVAERFKGAVLSGW